MPAKKNQRMSYRDTLILNQKAMDTWAAVYGKPTVSLGPIPDAPKKRERSTQAPAVPLEKDVQKSIIDFLLRHPKIGLVERINSGTMQSDNGDGTTRYTQFNKVYGRASNGEFMDMPDICCTLNGNGKRFVIEVKRPGWKKPTNDHERRQAAYIMHIVECGGYGMFATSVDDVALKLENIWHGN
jgi:hypothetical protein